MKFIDPHLHFFALEHGDYHWLKPENPPFWSDKADIAKTFTEKDLRLFGEQALAGYVHIEAGFDNARPWREIDWLESNCTLPMRSVAGCDLQADDFEAVMHALIQRQSVVGVRHILDDSAFVVLQSSKARRALSMLAEAELSFDAQLYGEDTAGISALIEVCHLMPALRVVVNHGGFPPASEINYANWKTNMSALAGCPNVAVKASGWEMTNRNWRTQSAAIIINDLINLFGADRVMLASNFPLSNWRYSYSEFWEQLIPSVPDAVRGQLCYQNAHSWYRF